MKFSIKKDRAPTKKEPPLPDSVDGLTYARLPVAVQAKYRPASTKYDRLPRFTLWLYGVAAVCVGLYIAFVLSPTFADLFNQTVSAAGRWLLAALTAWLPFSVGEFMIMMIPVILTGLLIYAFKYRCDTWRSTLTLVGTVFALIATFFSVFTLNFAAGYRGTTLDEKLGMDAVTVNADALYETAEQLRGQINAEVADVAYGNDGFSQMPYSLDTMRSHLDQAYADFCESHDFISHSPGRVKPVLLSEGMSYLHITGVYTFFTGEANINVAFPDYTVPFTAAHEMAHQRGIAREDEANFIAFLVCISSDDPYIRYSGYMNMYEYVASALSSSDREKFTQSYQELALPVRTEMAAYGEFFEKYHHSAASQVSGVVNDTFLQSQGTPGTQSYGMVVELAVAYYLQNADG